MKAEFLTFTYFISFFSIISMIENYFSLSVLVIKKKHWMLRPLSQSHYGHIIYRLYIKGIYIYILHYTHWPLIRYTLLVPGWTPFCLQNCLNSSWHRFNKVLKHSSEVLVHIDMIASRSCCRFVGCTSMMRISRSTTSQKVLYWIEIWWLWRPFE